MESALALQGGRGLLASGSQEAALEEAVEQLKAACRAYLPVSHLLWGLWGLIQVHLMSVSQIISDFFIFFYSVHVIRIHGLGAFQQLLYCSLPSGRILTVGLFFTIPNTGHLNMHSIIKVRHLAVQVASDNLCILWSVSCMESFLHVAFSFLFFSLKVDEYLLVSVLLKEAMMHAGTHLECSRI